MLYEGFMNHFYSKTSAYRNEFEHIGKNSKVYYPVISNKRSRKLLSIGDGTEILHNSRIQCFEQEGCPTPHIKIGDRCYLGFNLSILAGADVIIEDDVLLASNILITTETHGMDPESDVPYMSQPLTVAPVRVGSGCWLGERVVIMPGVTIGKKCIIGAGSIVTHDIPDYSIAVGSPAKVVKRYDFERHEWIRV